MNKISTHNLELLPNGIAFQNLCKSISAIEAIISPEWQYRYYSYQKDWGAGEEFCEMRNGQGDQMLILFNNNGIVINGFAHESEMNGWRKKTTKKYGSFFVNLFKSKNKEVSGQNIWPGVLKDLPKHFEDFIYGEPVKSIGTTFCIWQGNNEDTWHIGPVEFPKDKYLDGSSDLLHLLDNNPQTYKEWAEDYYDEQFEDFNLDFEAVEAIYKGSKITKALVLKISPSFSDFVQLKTDLNEIGYEHDFQ